MRNFPVILAQITCFLRQLYYGQKTASPANARRMKRAFAETPSSGIRKKTPATIIYKVASHGDLLVAPRLRLANFDEIRQSLIIIPSLPSGDLCCVSGLNLSFGTTISCTLGLLRWQRTHTTANGGNIPKCIC